MLDDRRLNRDASIAFDVEDASVDTGRGRELDQRQPTPHARGSRLPQANRVRGRLEDFARAGWDISQAVVRGSAVARGIQQAELHRIDSESARDQLRVRFNRERNLRFARAPHVPAGDRVGVDHVTLGAVHRDVVRPNRTTLEAGQGRVGARLERCVATTGEVAAHPTGHDVAIPTQARTHDDRRGVARVGGHELLGIGHHHLDGPSAGASQEIRQWNIHERAFAAEVSAQRQHMDVELLAP